MKTTLKKLTLINFKGARKLEVNFEDVTTISGENGSFKTTIFDAFTWLLFDKDSDGRKDFNIKTLDANNRVIPQIEHEVVGIINNGYNDITLRKVLREKWVKKHGESVTEFTGNECLYFADDVPLKQSEYKMKVDSILSEDLFRLITSTTYFNSLKWNDRRTVITKMAGEVSAEEIAGNRPDFKTLLAAIGNKSFEDYKKEIASKKRLLKENLESIPTRIDELDRNTPEMVDFNDISNAISELETIIASVDSQIIDKGKSLDTFYAAKQETLGKINALKAKRCAIESEQQSWINNAINKERAIDSERLGDIESLTSIIANANQNVSRVSTDIESLKKNRELVNIKIVNLRAQWNAENEKELVFDQHEFVCPSCRRAFESDDIEAKKAEMTANFNASKDAKLDAISADGSGYKKQLEAINLDIAKMTATVESITKEQENRNQSLLELQDKKPVVATIPTIDKLLNDNDDYQQLGNQIFTLEATLTDAPAIDTTELKNRKFALQQEVDGLKRELFAKDIIANNLKRKDELKAEESRLSQQVANLEKAEFAMAEFTKAKINTIEARINGLFKVVKFKMFEEQINGGESETCECMINGVPYSDLNTASKINAGVDIINALCNFYGVSAPVFIDNRESVNEIIPCNSQVVNLVVTKLPLSISSVKVSQEAIA